MIADSLAQARPLKPAARGPADGSQDYYQTILGYLAWPGSGPEPVLRTLGVTACHRGEGVSTVAAHLAITAAQHSDRRVALIDSNISHPSLHEAFRMLPGPGLTEVLLAGEPLHECLQTSEVENLSILTAGDLRGNTAQIYDTPELIEVVQSLREQFDLVLFDLPPAGRENAAIQLAGLLDGTLLVVQAERVRWEKAQQTKELLCRGHARLLGAVLNKQRAPMPRWISRT